MGAKGEYDNMAFVECQAYFDGMHSDSNNSVDRNIASDRQAVRETVHQTDRRTVPQTDRHTYRQTDRQAGRQTDRQAEARRHADRPHGQTHRLT